MKLEDQQLAELHDLYMSVLSDPFEYPKVPYKKRADRSDRSLKKFNKRLKKTGWPITKTVYDEALEKECVIPHNANLSLLKNNPHACRTCCNQKWVAKNYGKKETRRQYLKQYASMNDIEKDHFNGSWDGVDDFVWKEEYWRESNKSFYDNCADDSWFDDLWND
jgi:hypothetical protein